MPLDILVGGLEGFFSGEEHGAILEGEDVAWGLTAPSGASSFRHPGGCWAGVQVEKLANGEWLAESGKKWCRGAIHRVQTPSPGIKSAKRRGHVHRRVTDALED
jgi:hypothetical protein